MIIAKFEFSSMAALEAALDQIRKELGGGADRAGAILEIHDRIENSSRAAEIARAYGGQPR